jgi:hypothetical protein
MSVCPCMSHVTIVGYQTSLHCQAHYRNTVNQSTLQHQAGLRNLNNVSVIASQNEAGACTFEALALDDWMAAY